MTDLGDASRSSAARAAAPTSCGVAGFQAWSAARGRRTRITAAAKDLVLQLHRSPTPSEIARQAELSLDDIIETVAGGAVGFACVHAEDPPL
ncbi:MAG TPA: hypothetical protein VFJ14_13010 [Nocardioidaceae bacterium]|nr:hypothetical protein [Nocardioidaceae bacterium]